MTAPPPPCRLCGAPTRAALRRRPDYEYGVPVQLDYWRCRGCGLVFAQPVPSALVPSFYARYSTHVGEEATSHGGFWRAMSLIAPVPHLRPSPLAGLVLARDDAVLDFGCGGGAFLRRLRDAGHTSLAGYDFDPKAAAASLEGVRFFSRLEPLRTERFDVITLHHVIEHLEDPERTLSELIGLLKPGGRIYLRTPNTGSLLARLFGARWRGWETPRHLNVLGHGSLAAMVRRAGARVTWQQTSNDMFAGMFIGSMNNLLRGPAKKVLIGLGYAPLAWAAWAAQRLTGRSGEELVAVVAP